MRNFKPRPLHITRNGRVTFCGKDQRTLGDRIQVAPATDQGTCVACKAAYAAWHASVHPPRP